MKFIGVCLLSGLLFELFLEEELEAVAGSLSAKAALEKASSRR